MRITQSRRQFLTTLSLAGAASFQRVPESLAAEGPLETTSVRFMKTPSLCHAPQFVAEELLRAEGFTDIRYIESASSAEINPAVASGKIDFCTHFAPQWASVIDSGGAVTVLSRRSCRLLRAVRQRRHPQHCRSQREVGRRRGPRLQRPFVCVGHGGPYRARPGPRYPLGHEPVSNPSRVVRGRQDRCLPRSPARASRPAHPAYRPRHRQQLIGPAVVAIFLLHAGGPPRLCAEISGRDEASAARRAEGGRSLCRPA